MPDCIIRYRGTKLAKTKELQLELINFAQFSEKFWKSRFWAILRKVLLLNPKQLLFDCKCCNRSKESVYTIFCPIWRIVLKLAFSSYFSCKFCVNKDPVVTAWRVFAFPCRYADMIPRFAKPVPVNDIAFKSLEMVSHAFPLSGLRNLIWYGSMSRTSRHISMSWSWLHVKFGFLKIN